MAARRSWAVLETRTFFIMFARWASTVFTLMSSFAPISLFFRPPQIRRRICRSRVVKPRGGLREKLRAAPPGLPVFAVRVVMGLAPAFDQPAPVSGKG